MDITYQALPFPLPDAEQQRLRQVVQNIQSFYEESESRVPKPGHLYDHRVAVAEMNDYIDTLRSRIGVEVTRPEILPRSGWTV